jgi:putative FmdB family regulatory protein
MPRYEFMCEKGNKPFELIMTFAEREKGGVKCPTCQGAKVVPQFSGFGGQVLAPEPGTGDRPRDGPRTGSCTSRPREATPERWRSRAGSRASHHRDDDVPRDGHDVLVGEGGGGDDGFEEIDGKPRPVI